MGDIVDTIADPIGALFQGAGFDIPTAAGVTNKAVSGIESVPVLGGLFDAAANAFTYGGFGAVKAAKTGDPTNLIGAAAGAAGAFGGPGTASPVATNVGRFFGTSADVGEEASFGATSALDTAVTSPLAPGSLDVGPIGVPLTEEGAAQTFPFVDPSGSITTGTPEGTPLPPGGGGSTPFGGGSLISPGGDASSGRTFRDLLGITSSGPTDPDATTNIFKNFAKQGEVDKGGGIFGSFGLGDALNIGSGGYGLLEALKLKKLAGQRPTPIPGSVPTSATAADTRLTGLINDPASIKNDPGYQFGLDQGTQTVMRQMAAMGLTGSGNEMIALQKWGTDYATGFLNQQEQNLSRLAAGNVPQFSSPNIQGETGALDLAGKSLASLGYGVNKLQNPFPG